MYILRRKTYELNYNLVLQILFCKYLFYLLIIKLYYL